MTRMISCDFIHNTSAADLCVLCGGEVSQAANLLRLFLLFLFLQSLSVHHILQETVYMPALHHCYSLALLGIDCSWWQQLLTKV